MTVDGLPAEMQAQANARHKLLTEMQDAGVIASDINDLETPVVLVMQLKDDALLATHKSLMKTRRRWVQFGLNGRVYWPTRSCAIAIVRVEMQARAAK